MVCAVAPMDPAWCRTVQQLLPFSLDIAALSRKTAQASATIPPCESLGVPQALPLLIRRER